MGKKKKKDGEKTQESQENMWGYNAADIEFDQTYNINCAETMWPV